MVRDLYSTFSMCICSNALLNFEQFELRGKIGRQHVKEPMATAISQFMISPRGLHPPTQSSGEVFFKFQFYVLT